MRRPRVPASAGTTVKTRCLPESSATPGGPYFGDYPPDFFDFIVIDECHRGGANDESNWRGILDYFAPAVQLGLTATPKRKDNIHTYAYFGEPVYTYSLKDGINDGFLTPFKVKQISTTLNDYVYTPDDAVIEGEIETGGRYTEREFNKVIEIKEREAHRVRLFMEQTNHKFKQIIGRVRGFMRARITSRSGISKSALISTVSSGFSLILCCRIMCVSGSKSSTAKNCGRCCCLNIITRSPMPSRILANPRRLAIFSRVSKNIFISRRPDAAQFGAALTDDAPGSVRPVCCG